MSEGTIRPEDGRQGPTSANAGSWQTADQAQYPGVGQPQILPPPPDQAYRYAGPQGFPPPPPQPNYGQPGAGQAQYRPVYDGLGPQPGYGQAPYGQPGAPYVYNGQPMYGQQPGYPPQQNYGFGTTAAEVLAASWLLRGGRWGRPRGYGYGYGCGAYSRYRSPHMLWRFFALIFLFFFAAHHLRAFLFDW